MEISQKDKLEFISKITDEDEELLNIRQDYFTSTGNQFAQTESDDEKGENNITFFKKIETILREIEPSTTNRELFESIYDFHKELNFEKNEEINTNNQEISETTHGKIEQGPPPKENKEELEHESQLVSENVKYTENSTQENKKEGSLALLSEEIKNLYKIDATTLNNEEISKPSDETKAEPKFEKKEELEKVIQVAFVRDNEENTNVSVPTFGTSEFTTIDKVLAKSIEVREKELEKSTPETPTIIEKEKQATLSLLSDIENPNVLIQDPIAKNDQTSPLDIHIDFKTNVTTNETLNDYLYTSEIEITTTDKDLAELIEVREKELEISTSETPTIKEKETTLSLLRDIENPSNALNQDPIAKNDQTSPLDIHTDFKTNVTTNETLNDYLYSQNADLYEESQPQVANREKQKKDYRNSKLKSKFETSNRLPSYDYGWFFSI